MAPTMASAPTPSMTRARGSTRLPNDTPTRAMPVSADRTTKVTMRRRIPDTVIVPLCKPYCGRLACSASVPRWASPSSFDKLASICKQSVVATARAATPQRTAGHASPVPRMMPATDSGSVLRRNERIYCFILNYELRIANYKLRITNYELRTFGAARANMLA